MVTVSTTMLCPHCKGEEAVIRHTRNRSGTDRFFCKDCDRAFTPSPRSRQVTEERKALVMNALKEKMPINAICRTFKISPKTVYSLLKKG